MENSTLKTITTNILNEKDFLNLGKDFAKPLPQEISLESVKLFVSTMVPQMYSCMINHDFRSLLNSFSQEAVEALKFLSAHYVGNEPNLVEVNLVGLTPDQANKDFMELRIHLTVHAADSDGSPVILQQFWDVSGNHSFEGSLSQCPNCGAPVEAGTIVCKYCHSDLRSESTATIFVSRVQSY